MTPDPQAKLKVGLLLAIGVCLIVAFAGLVSCMLQIERGVDAGPAQSAETNQGRIMMATVSRRLATDRPWLMSGEAAELAFGPAVYRIELLDQPLPVLTIDISGAIDARTAVAGRAASVAFAVADAPESAADQFEVGQALAERRKDVRVVNGVEMAVEGDRLTLRHAAG